MRYIKNHERYNFIWKFVLDYIKNYGGDDLNNLLSDIENIYICLGYE